MKTSAIFKILAVLSAFFIASSALAQNPGTVTNHAFVIGKGAGTSGFTSLLCGSTQLAVGQSAADPICRTLSGDVTLDAAGVTAIGTAKVTSAMLRNSAALSVIGRSANSTGVPADISCSAGSDAVLRESGSTLGCGTIATAGIANNAVTLAKLATQAANTALVNATSGAAVPTAFAMPSCSTSASALQWTTNSGFGCNTAISVAIANVTGLGAGVGTWLATPSSANLAAALTDETGSGAAVFATSPSLTTPTLGVASATTINKVTITAPASAATLTIPDGVTLTGPASSGTAATLGNTETFTGVKTFGSAGAVGRLKIAGTTSGAITLDATAVAGSGTLTLPAATDTLVGKATTDTFTNKTFDSAATGNTLQVSGVTVSRGQFPGFNTNSSATAGNLGEYVESVIASGSAVAATTGTPSNVTSISLTAGNWIVTGAVLQNPAATTSFTANGFSISTTSATLDGTYVQFDRFAAFVPANPFGGFSISRRLSLPGTTTVYLVQQCTFTVSTTGGYGYIFAHRI